jgi:outer membrane protein W
MREVERARKLSQPHYRITKKTVTRMKKTLYIIMLLSFAFTAFAQNAPKKNDLMFSFTFGTGSHIGTSAPAPNLSNYTLAAPMTAWFDKTPVLGIEGRWFFTDKWALKLTGGLNYSYNPGYNELTGTADISRPTIDVGEIPTYNAVANAGNIQFHIGTGADYYFSPVSNNLSLRLGGEFRYAYGRLTANATDSEDYMGAAIGEAFGFGIAPVMGADYFFAGNLFLGFDIRPLAYQYSVFNERPQAGLGLLSSDNHTFSILSQPTLKIGIRF